MIVLALDTATAATTAAVLDARDPAAAAERRHDPAPGERPGHATRLLGLCATALEAADADWGDLGRIAVGTGPGSFTGLRIGLATAHGLALSRDLPLVGVSSLHALAAGALDAAPGGRVAAVLDARRGEAFAAAWDREAAAMPPAALAPKPLAAALAGLPGPRLAVGDGALRFRALIERAGLEVPDDDSPLHRVSASLLARLALDVRPGARGTVLPDYLRRPDAELARAGRERA